MPRITKLTVAKGHTFNLGDYNSLRTDFQLEIAFDESPSDEELEAVRTEAMNQITGWIAEEEQKYTP